MTFEMRFSSTPGKPGTGWFDREGVERPKHGVFGEGKYEGKPYSVYTKTCSRCGGAGGSEHWARTGWTCYECSGSGKGRTFQKRLYTAEELAVLNARQAVQQAKRQVKRAAAAAALKAEQEASAAARRASLEADPFYVEFRGLVSTFNALTYRDEGYDREDKRRPLPDFLRDMWTQIQHTDLSERQQAAVQKFIDSRAAEARRKANARFIGNEGDRITIRATVLFVKQLHVSTWAGDPNKFLIKFETADGFLLTWFTAKFFEKGWTVIGKATVKAHKEFNGMKETQITNFRVTDEIAPGDDKQIEGLTAETTVTPAKAKKVQKGTLDPEDRRACPCGSCLPKRELVDARNISCGYVCDNCEKAKRAGYRPEIFTDSRYYTDEPIEAD